MSRGRGHPGKHGTFDELMLRTFNGVSIEAMERIFSNLETSIFSPVTYPDTARNFKADTVAFLGEVHKFARDQVARLARVSRKQAFAQIAQQELEKLRVLNAQAGPEEE